MSSSSKFIQIHRYIRYKTQTQNLIIYFFATKKEISPKKKLPTTSEKSYTEEKKIPKSFFLLLPIEI